jgi:RsiW-degrading membrane proteinase PrsW (M82 family)
MKILRSILAFLVGFTVAIAPAMKFIRYTHHNALNPAPVGYIVIAAAFGVVFSLLGGFLSARIAPSNAHHVGDAIMYVILACACWSLWVSPGRDHWFLFIAILLMTPAVYIGNRLAS